MECNTLIGSQSTITPKAKANLENGDDKQCLVSLRFSKAICRIFEERVAIGIITIASLRVRI